MEPFVGRGWGAGLSRGLRGEDQAGAGGQGGQGQGRQGQGRLVGMPSAALGHRGCSELSEPALVVGQGRRTVAAVGLGPWGAGLHVKGMA